MAAKPFSPEGQRLVQILADMLRSALAWEEQHGAPLEVAGCGVGDALKDDPLRVYSGQGRGKGEFIKEGDDVDTGDQEERA